HHIPVIRHVNALCLFSSMHHFSPLLFPYVSFFFFNATAPTEIYTLSLHDALPISIHVLHLSDHPVIPWRFDNAPPFPSGALSNRSEEHTSELQSPCNLVCRLLLEKKKKTQRQQRQPSHVHEHLLRLHIRPRPPGTS